MTAVLSPMDALKKERPMSLDDNGMNFLSGNTDWRTKYNEVVDMLAETKAELDEFHHASKELEAELESELARTEKSQQDLRIKVSKAESERDDWKSKFMSLQTAHNTTTTSLQRELDRLRQEYQQLKVQMRELEMGNDDLERTERAVSSSLADMETKYSRVLEEKILLEQELLEKVSLEEGTQRLKDELRDANEEISMLKNRLTEATTAAEKAAADARQLRSRMPPPPTDNLKSGTPPDLELADLSPQAESTSLIERAQSRKSTQQPQVVSFGHRWHFLQPFVICKFPSTYSGNTYPQSRERHFLYKHLNNHYAFEK
ncbi:hypothetical protein EST38_g1086 [Candolleomyces aberdarensis]|uniref:NUDE domain-containing protein n=1 Tax=Candolleomyces aberdarensis TaxID=2316362 RepID=A0A4Q2DZE2_9AGAR|nr:hypothetical protein EST38_g1086 [Candolleomyces aberdarensis]